MRERPCVKSLLQSQTHHSRKSPVFRTHNVLGSRAWRDARLLHRYRVGTAPLPPLLEPWSV